jgi:hypothetical protein
MEASNPNKADQRVYHIIVSSSGYGPRERLQYAVVNSATLELVWTSAKELESELDALVEYERQATDHICDMRCKLLDKVVSSSDEFNSSDTEEC